MSTLHPFWVSWYRHPTVPFTLHSPWWVSGKSAAVGETICAAIYALNIPDARDRIIASHDTPEFTSKFLSWRFVEQRPAGWSPFSERFPRADWMEWPEPAPVPTPDRSMARDGAYIVGVEARHVAALLGLPQKDPALDILERALHIAQADAYRKSALALTGASDTARALGLNTRVVAVLDGLRTFLERARARSQEDASIVRAPDADVPALVWKPMRDGKDSALRADGVGPYTFVVHRDGGTPRWTLYSDGVSFAGSPANTESEAKGTCEALARLLR